MVAHATVLLLALAPAVAPPGGRHRAPPEDDGLQPARRLAVVLRARRAPIVFVDENDILAALCWERATGFEASVVEGRFMIQTRRGQSPWVVIVEPDAEASLLVVVTVYEVSQ